MRWLRRLMVVVGVGGMGWLVVLGMGGFSTEEEFSPALVQEAVVNERMRIVSLRLEGVSDKGEAYTLRAESAWHEGAGVLETLRLEKVSGTLAMQGGEVEMRAPGGKLHRTEKSLMFEGGIEVEGRGFSFRAGKVFVDLGKGVFWARGGVRMVVRKVT